MRKCEPGRSRWRSSCSPRSELREKLDKSNQGPVIYEALNSRQLGWELRAGSRGQLKSEGTLQSSATQTKGNYKNKSIPLNRSTKTILELDKLPLKARYRLCEVSERQAAQTDGQLAVLDSVYPRAAEGVVSLSGGEAIIVSGLDLVLFAACVTSSAARHASTEDCDAPLPCR